MENLNPDADSYVFVHEVALTDSMTGSMPSKVAILKE